MTCQRCKSNRIVNILAKCSDGCHFDFPSEGIRRLGYAPRIPYVTGFDEDYVEFSVCLDCGQMQGEFPTAVPKSNG